MSVRAARLTKAFHLTPQGCDVLLAMLDSDEEASIDTLIAAMNQRGRRGANDNRREVLKTIISKVRVQVQGVAKIEVVGRRYEKGKPGMSPATSYRISEGRTELLEVAGDEKSVGPEEIALPKAWALSKSEAAIFREMVKRLFCSTFDLMGALEAVNLKPSSSESVKVHVCKLREKLPATLEIRTFYNRGYALSDESRARLPAALAGLTPPRDPAPELVR